MAKGSIVKTLLAGVAGGAIALSGGAAYEAIQGNNGVVTTTANTTGSSAKVNSTSYKVNSDVTTAISKVSDAIVSVLNYQPQQQTNNGIYGGIFGGGNSNNNSNNSAVQLTSEGSGVIYKKSGDTAYLVTNYHVVYGATKLQIQLASGRTLDAAMVGTDPTKDLAVLKISSQYVTEVAVFGDSSKLTVGEPAIAIGSPLGTTFANSATEGIISALSRTVSYDPTGNQNNNVVSNINALQTDAAINPGNSGGALINIQGQVIGINSSKLATVSTADQTAVQGMGFAIPSNDVVNVIDKIESGKKTPALGVINPLDLSDVNSQQQIAQYNLKLPSSVTSGVVLTGIQAGLPADKAGLKSGDVIVKLGSYNVSTFGTLQSALLNYNVGDTVEATYYRSGQKHTVQVHLDADSGQLQHNNSNNQGGN